MKTMKLSLLAIAALMMAGTLNAQERTAGSSVEQQMTWTALATQIKAVGTDVSNTSVRVEQIVACGKKGMIYSPTTTGADTQGCVEVSKAGDTATNITKIVNTLNATNTTMNLLLGCNKTGKVYNGTTCVGAVSAAPDCKLVTQVTAANSSCPSGSAMLEKIETTTGGNCSSCNPRIVVSYRCAKIQCN